MRAQEEGVTGKAVTPYLVSRVSEIAGGISAASVELGLNNARLAAAIAVAYSKV
ncbi:Pseudouridine-5'-phosphate glycosidase [compost metagenome]